MDWIIKKLSRNTKKNRIYRKPETQCHHNPDDIITVDKNIIDYISKDELFIKLVAELGHNGFNDWFQETFNEPPPYIDTTGMKSMKRFSSKRFKIKETSNEK